MPIPLAVVGAGMFLGGSAFSLAGSRQSAAAVEAAGAMNAQLIWLDTLREMMVSQEETETIYGQQRAIFGAAGLRVGTGSPLLVQAETLRRGAQELAFIQQRGEFAAKLARWEAATSAQAIRTQAYAKLLSGAGTLALAG